MFDLKKYKFEFDIWGFVLFLVIMIPNFIWFKIPASNDILRTESVTPLTDTIASIFQVIMVITLCILRNSGYEKTIPRAYRISIIICVLLYFAGWAMYYLGFANSVVIFDLTVIPCAVFILFSLARKNLIAGAFAIAFFICHLIFSVANFIM